MTQQIYTYRLPSGKASLIEPLTNSGFFELSASSFSKNHLLQALAEALTLLHNQNKPALESQQQNTSMVPANEQTQPSVGTVACVAEARPDPLLFQCHACGCQHFNFCLSYGSVFYLICTHGRCHTQYKFNTSNGPSVLTHVNAKPYVSQHLSTESVDKVGE